MHATFTIFSSANGSRTNAREMQQQMAQIQAQMQQVSPEEAQMINNKCKWLWNNLVLQIMAQLASEFLQSIGMGGSEDPLVDIRKQELDLKDKELDMESEQFVAKQRKEHKKKY